MTEQMSQGEPSVPRMSPPVARVAAGLGGLALGIGLYVVASAEAGAAANPSPSASVPASGAATHPPDAPLIDQALLDQVGPGWSLMVLSSTSDGPLGLTTYVVSPNGALYLSGAGAGQARHRVVAWDPSGVTAYAIASNSTSSWIVSIDVATGESTVLVTVSEDGDSFASLDYLGRVPGGETTWLASFDGTYRVLTVSATGDVTESALPSEPNLEVGGSPAGTVGPWLLLGDPTDIETWSSYDVAGARTVDLKVPNDGSHGCHAITWLDATTLVVGCNRFQSDSLVLYDVDVTGVSAAKRSDPATVPFADLAASGDYLVPGTPLVLITPIGSTDILGARVVTEQGLIDIGTPGVFVGQDGASAVSVRETFPGEYVLRYETGEEVTVDVNTGQTWRGGWIPLGIALPNGVEASRVAFGQ